jgi:hypothetical protein
MKSDGRGGLKCRQCHTHTQGEGRWAVDAARASAGTGRNAGHRRGAQGDSTPDAAEGPFPALPSLIQPQPAHSSPALHRVADSVRAPPAAAEAKTPRMRGAAFSALQVALPSARTLRATPRQPGHATAARLPRRRLSRNAAFPHSARLRPATARWRAVGSAQPAVARRPGPSLSESLRVAPSALWLKSRMPQRDRRPASVP